MHKRLAQIEQRIARVKAELQQIGEMRPGSLTRQYHNPKQKKGAYYQLSYTYEMKSRTEYVRALFVPDIRQQVTNFKRFRTLVQRWTDLAIRHSKLKMELANREQKKLSSG